MTNADEGKLFTDFARPTLQDCAKHTKLEPYVKHFVAHQSQQELLYKVNLSPHRAKTLLTEMIKFFPV